MGRGREGGELFLHQDRGRILVLLPEAPAAGETVTVELRYGGEVIEKLDTKSFLLRDTLSWYPHAGTVDRARYDVTLHVDLLSESLLRASREELLQAVIDTLAYFEESFGPYPLDELTVVTAPRLFSQSLLGYVTLSSVMVSDELAWLGFEDYRTVIAHEIAHQWWGHQVGWKSYRDQWISEAAANYSAVLFARNRLKLAGHRGPTARWQSALTSTTEDGRSLESVGPVVLGQRLVSTRGEGAYEPIVYRKGAVVLDMLARTWGEENFVKLLRAIVEAASFRPISTEDFLALIERVTGHDMNPFARQFIYGTGLPEVYYSYSFEESPNGGWTVAGRAAEAGEAFRRALAAPTFAGADFDREVDPKALEESGRRLDRRIHLSLARLALSEGRDAEAAPALDRAETLAKKNDAWWLDEDLRVLRSRLALRRGDARAAYDLLRKKLLRDRIYDTEGLAALAIAARAVGDEKEYEAAVEGLDGTGVNLSALTGGS